MKCGLNTCKKEAVKEFGDLIIGLCFVCGEHYEKLKSGECRLEVKK